MFLHVAIGFGSLNLARTPISTRTTKISRKMTRQILQFQVAIYIRYVVVTIPAFQIPVERVLQNYSLSDSSCRQIIQYTEQSISKCLFKFLNRRQSHRRQFKFLLCLKTRFKIGKLVKHATVDIKE